MKKFTLEALAGRDIGELRRITEERIARLIATEILEEEEHAQDGRLLLQGVDEEG